MDLRTYDTVPHGLQTNYEDFKPGWNSAYGVAHTSELTLFPFSSFSPLSSCWPFCSP